MTDVLMDPTIVTAKRCTGCEQTKPLDQFSPMKKGLHGRHSRCKTCLATKSRANGQKRKAARVAAIDPATDTRPRVPRWINLNELAAELERPSEGWGDVAACGGMSAESYATFFPIGSSHTVYAKPMAVCARCPVRVCCVAAGMGDAHGCFGSTPDQRRRLATELRLSGRAVPDRRVSRVPLSG